MDEKIETASQAEEREPHQPHLEKAEAESEEVHLQRTSWIFQLLRIKPLRVILVGISTLLCFVFIMIKMSSVQSMKPKTLTFEFGNIKLALDISEAKTPAQTSTDKNPQPTQSIFNFNVALQSESRPIDDQKTLDKTKLSSDHPIKSCSELSPSSEDELRAEIEFLNSERHRMEARMDNHAEALIETAFEISALKNNHDSDIEQIESFEYREVAWDTWDLEDRQRFASDEFEQNWEVGAQDIFQF